MSGLLQIRNVPDDARRALKVRAAERGQSLNAFLLELIRREVERPTVEEVLQRAERRAERSPVSALDVLADAREQRRRELGSA